MSTNTRMFILGFGVALIAVAAALAWWGSQPPAYLDSVIHNPIAKRLKHKPRIIAPVYQAPVRPPIPAALTSAPPAEVWLPAPLSVDDAAKRAVADHFLMKVERLADNKISNTMFLQGELNDLKYDQLDPQLDAVTALATTDPAYELVEAEVAGFADGNDVTRGVDKFQLDDWLKARPNSAWAHYSAGLHWSNMAWDARGNGWASDVPKSAWHKVHIYEGNARAELHKALKLNPRIAPAWVLLIDVDQVDAGLGDVKRDYEQGLKQRPADFEIANKYINALNPHWFGTYPEVADFASRQQVNAATNPRFRILLGVEQGMRGCISCNNYDWATALKHYNAALQYVDDVYWLDKAGEAAVHLHRYALAYRYYERAHAYEHGVFKYEAEDGLLQARCDPKEDPEKFKVFKSETYRYSGIEVIDYPDAPDACRYYQAELPWGGEPLPDDQGILEYSIQNEVLKAQREKLQAGHK